MEGTAANIVGKYFTEAMVKKIAVSRNGYRSERKKLTLISKSGQRKIERLPVPLLHHACTTLSPSSTTLEWFDFPASAITGIIHPATCPPIPSAANLV